MAKQESEDFVKGKSGFSIESPSEVEAEIEAEVVEAPEKPKKASSKKGPVYGRKGNGPLYIK